MNTQKHGCAPDKTLKSKCGLAESLQHHAKYDCGDDLCGTCVSLGTLALDVLLLGPRLLKATGDSAINVIKETLCHEKKAFCHIPETGCPPRCVCQINWCGAVNDTLKHHIQVTNTGKYERNFELISIPFPCSDVRVCLAKNFATLKPGETFHTIATLTIPEVFKGSVMETQILVRGCYEQCIKVHLHVKPHQHTCCVVEQGEIPTRIKAHRWFHHYQCEEPCFEAIGPVRPDSYERETDR